MSSLRSFVISVIEILRVDIWSTSSVDKTNPFGKTGKVGEAGDAGEADEFRCLPQNRLVSISEPTSPACLNNCKS